MRKLFVVPLLLACSAAVLAVATATAQEGPPPPSAGEVLASGLSSTGATIGPDGALYVGVSGVAEANDTQITFPPEFAEQVGAPIGYFGFHSKVVRVDPTTGETTEYLGLPSAGTEPGGEPGVGPADVAFIGDRLYALVTGSANYAGGAAADYPNGIYRLNDNKTWTVFADLSQFNDSHPVAFPDAGPGGNPFALDVRNGEFIVSDGNFNRLLSVDGDGAIRIFASFDNVVPTGLATGSSGPVYVTLFSAFPHAPEDSSLVSLGFPTGDNVTDIAGGFAQLIDVEFAGGQTYVLQFGDQQLDEEAPPLPGRLLLLQDGELLPIVTGLTLPTSVNFWGDTAYITSLTGDVLKIEGVSSLAPEVEEPAPAPTTAPPAPAPTPPTGTIRPPDTGMGSGTTGSGLSLLLLVAVIGISGVAVTGAAAAATRR